MSKKRFSPFINYLILGFDFLFLLILFLTIVILRYKGFGLTYNALIQIALSYYRESFLILFSWLLLSGYTRIYKDLRFIRFIDLFKSNMYQYISYCIILLAILGGDERFYNYKESSAFLLILFSYLFISRLVIHSGLKIYRKKGFNLRNVIILGDNDNSLDLIELINKRKDFGLNLINVFTDKKNITKAKSLDLDELDNYLLVNNIEYAYICLGSSIQNNLVSNIIEIFEKHYISIGFIPNTSLETKQTLEVKYLDAFPILTYKKYPLDHSFNQIIKRIFDLVFSIFVFIFILSWVYPVISLLVLIYQGKPIHFSQKRNGLNGKEFSCLKFRSMRDDKHNNLKPTERDDPRVTKLGRILRRTSLDELPQFINVLKGEMSIVGPRPHMVSENESYSDIIKRYSLRHYVKPGITGLAQVKGYRGAVDTDKDMEMRIRTDIYYVRNWSFLLDLFIIYKTGKLMISGDENAI